MTDTAEKAPPYIRAIADDLADARNALDAHKDEQKRLQEIHDAYEAKLFDALEDQGIRSFRTERGLFSLNDLAWANVPDEEAARQWATEAMPELLTLNRQRLSVIIRKTLKEEEAMPGLELGQLPPGVDYRTQRKISWRRT